MGLFWPQGKMGVFTLGRNGFFFYLRAKWIDEIGVLLRWNVDLTGVKWYLNGEKCNVTSKIHYDLEWKRRGTMTVNSPRISQVDFQKFSKSRSLIRYINHRSWSIISIILKVRKENWRNVHNWSPTFWWIKICLYCNKYWWCQQG